MTRILYLGPKDTRTHNSTTITQQSKAASEIGGEVIRYSGDSEGELIEALKSVDSVMNQGHGFSANLFKHMGNNGRCKGLVGFGHGFDGLDVQSAVENGVILSNTASFGTEEVSNHTLMHLLVCSRKFVLHDKLLKRGVWTREYLHPMGHLSDQTLGVIGIGNIGRAITRKAHALGMKIIAFDPYISAWDSKEYNVKMVPTLFDIARYSDYVTLHTYLTDETHHMISTDFFREMKNTAYLINCSRGPVVDEKALITALENKTIAGAGLDVFEDEPPNPENPLLKMDNVSATNHYASYSESAWDRAQIQLGEEAVRIATGYWPMSLINPDVRSKIDPRKQAMRWEITKNIILEENI